MATIPIRALLEQLTRTLEKNSTTPCTIECVTPVRSGQNLVAARAPRSLKNGGKHTKTSVPPTTKALDSHWNLPEQMMFGEGL